jgi:hypothetical protein
MPDDGLADPALADALASGSRARVLGALASARVFSAVSAVATAEHLTEGGLRAESSAEMAVLLLEADGVRALPVFTSVPALLAWRPDARPVALRGPDACAAALDEGARALLLDPAGPAWEVTQDELRTIAGGYVPVDGAPLATRRTQEALTAPSGAVPAELVVALERAVAGERLRAARVLEGPDGLVLGIAPRGSLDAPALAALARRVMARMGEALPAEGLDLAQVPPRGPGLALRVGRFRRVR